MDEVSYVAMRKEKSVFLVSTLRLCGNFPYKKLNYFEFASNKFLAH